MADNNSLGDLKYKLYLRVMFEFEMTAFAVAPDNPRGLSATEINNFKAYRAAWADQMDSPPADAAVSEDTGMMLGLEMPDFPVGWVAQTRAQGDLPPIICRVTDFDAYDPSAA